MVLKYKFRGLMVPVFTPFIKSSEQEPCINCIPEYASYLQEKGVSGILVNGTTGEGVSMTTEERKKVAEAWLQASQNTNQTIMIQIGGASIADVKDMARHAAKLKASALLCLPDLFFKPKTVPELILYLKEIAKEAPNMPLFYYHIPAFTDVHLDMNEFLKRGKESIPSLSGIKFTNNDLDVGSKCLQVDPDFTIFLGADTLYAAALVMGFDSAIMTTLNFWPDDFRLIKNNIEDGKISEACRIQHKINDAISRILERGTWVPAMKHTMTIQYLDVGHPRPPLQINPDILD